MAIQHRRISRRTMLAGAAALGLTGSLAACGGSDDNDDSGKNDGDSGRPVKLTYWSWAPNMDKVAAIWNKKNPNITVTVSKQVSGGEIVGKLITAKKAGNAPDLIQAEYQSLPTLVSNDVLTDIAKYAGDAKSEFSEGLWGMVTLGTDAVYAIPQDSGPLMFYYREDLFKQHGLSVPKTWTEFAETARAAKKALPNAYLTTFSANDPGLFAGLSQQAGAKWWTVDSGGQWTVGIDDAATRQVTEFWGGLVQEGVIDNQPMYTPAWNNALNKGTHIGWVSAVWAPGVLVSSAPDTKGKWRMAPLPQWKTGDDVTGSWGGSSTGVSTDSEHAEAAAEFARWINTDPEALAALVKEAAVYPAATKGQSGSILTTPEFFPNQPDFYDTAAEIAATTAASAWGPNVTIAYTTFNDAFGKATKAKKEDQFLTALTTMQSKTFDDMKKQGFKVAEA
ncbi:extracellular solute-binding protein [Streptomyces sp. NBC_00124]|uniref:ABC transporter substrate-binding protein n=1 Tax=Streptomyces sp. NBC_00124 TaxID=2975662 RepID=UPI002256C5B5|nr:substrate-binding domain-containing protein [Streptomyces sp. NBC_00124]MCX5361536.1 extracellular solute-binding protein [Streptomyces sp. NBC_00124]